MNGLDNDPTKEIKESKKSRDAIMLEKFRVNDPKKVPIPKHLKGKARDLYVSSKAPTQYKQPDYEFTSTDIDVGNNIDLSKYDNYLGVGSVDVGNMKGAGDARANAQSNWEKTYLTAGNSIANVIPGIIGDIAGMAEVFDSTGDYSNAVTEWADASRNVFGDTYVREGDTNWWEVGSGAITSVAQFGLEGWGIGSALGKLGSITGKAIRGANTIDKMKGTYKLASPIFQSGNISSIGRTTAKGLSNVGSKIVNATAKVAETVIPQVATAGLLSYVEARAEADKTYKEIYGKYKDEYIKKFGKEGDAKAKELAKNAAKNTLDFGIYRNLPLNLTILKPFFRSGNASKELVKKFGMERLSSEMGKRGEKVFLKRINNIKNSKEYKRHIRGSYLGSYGGEMLQEGTEELSTEYSGKVGAKYAEAEAHKQLGKEGKQPKFSFTGELLDPTGTFKQLGTKEGRIAFGVGALMGGGQKAVMGFIPRKTYDNNGKLIRLSNEAQSRKHKEDLYETTKESMFHDIKQIQKLQDELQDIELSSSSEEKKGKRTKNEVMNDLFDITSFNAVSLGIADSHISEYDYISKLDNKDVGKPNREVEENLTKLKESLGEVNRQLEDAGNMNEEDMSPEVKQQLEELNSVKSDIEADIEKQKKESEKTKGMTDAMYYGYATDVNDNSYVDKAKTAIEELQELDKTFKYYQASYGQGEDGMYKVPERLLQLRMAEINSRKSLRSREEDLDVTLGKYIKGNNAEYGGSKDDKAFKLNKIFAKEEELRILEESRKLDTDKDNKSIYSKLIEEVEEGLEEMKLNLSSTEATKYNKLKSDIDAVMSAYNTRLDEIVSKEDTELAKYNESISKTENEHRKKILNRFNKASEELKADKSKSFSMANANKSNSERQFISKNGDITFKREGSVLKAIYKEDGESIVISTARIHNNNVEKALEYMRNGDLSIGEYESSKLDKVNKDYDKRISNIESKLQEERVEKLEKVRKEIGESSAKYEEARKKVEEDLANYYDKILKSTTEERDSKIQEIEEASSEGDTFGINQAEIENERELRKSQIVNIESITKDLNLANKGDGYAAKRLSNNFGFEFDIKKLQKAKNKKELLTSNYTDETALELLNKVFENQGQFSAINEYDGYSESQKEALSNYTEYFKDLIEAKVGIIKAHDRLMTKEGLNEYKKVAKKHSDQINKNNEKKLAEEEGKVEDKKNKVNREGKDKLVEAINADSNKKKAEDGVEGKVESEEKEKSPEVPKKDLKEILGSAVYGGINEIAGIRLNNFTAEINTKLNTPNIPAEQTTELNRILSTLDSMKGNIVNWKQIYEDEIRADGFEFNGSRLQQDFKALSVLYSNLKKGTYEPKLLEDLKNTNFSKQYKTNDTKDFEDFGNDIKEEIENSKDEVEDVTEEQIEDTVEPKPKLSKDVRAQAIIDKAVASTTLISEVIEKNNLGNEDLAQELVDTFNHIKEELMQAASYRVSSDTANSVYLDDTLAMLKSYYRQKQDVINEEAGMVVSNIPFSALTTDNKGNLKLSDLFSNTVVSKHTEPTSKYPEPAFENNESNVTNVTPYDSKRTSGTTIQVPGTVFDDVTNKQLATSISATPLESANIVKTNSKVKVTVDTNYEGNIVLRDKDGNIKETVKWPNYLNKLKNRAADKGVNVEQLDGYIKNVPIKIEQDGKLVGYLPVYDRVNSNTIKETKKGGNIALQREQVKADRIKIVALGSTEMNVDFKLRGRPNIKMANANERNIDTYDTAAKRLTGMPLIGKPVVGINMGEKGIFTLVDGKPFHVIMDVNSKADKALSDIVKARAGITHALSVDNKGNIVPLVMSNSAHTSIGGNVSIQGETKNITDDVTETVVDYLNAVIDPNFKKILKGKDMIPGLEIGGKSGINVKDRLTGLIHIKTVASTSDINIDLVNERPTVFYVKDKEEMGYYLVRPLAKTVKLDASNIRSDGVVKAISSLPHASSVKLLEANSNIHIKGSDGKYKQMNYMEYLATRVATNVVQKTMKAKDGDINSKEGVEFVYYNNPVAPLSFFNTEESLKKEEKVREECKNGTTVTGGKTLQGNTKVAKRTRKAKTKVREPK